MWRKKSKPATPEAKKKKTRNAFSLLLLALAVAGCGKSPPETRPDRPWIRILHLTDFAWQDRNQTGQPVDFKPEPEVAALFRELQTTGPDVLVLRGLGSRAAFQEFWSRGGSRIPGKYTRTYLPGPTLYEGLGFLLNGGIPPAETLNLSESRYTIDGQEYAPLAGAVLMPRGDLWLWNAVWPEPDAPYEQRRNEARLLAQAVRDQVENGKQVLVTLHSREELDSPMFRMLEDAGVVRVRAVDPRGDSWTHRDPEGVLYRQDQWIFATPDLAARLRGEVIDSEDIRTAGHYRHQLLYLK